MALGHDLAFLNIKSPAKPGSAKVFASASQRHRNTANRKEQVSGFWKGAKRLGRAAASRRAAPQDYGEVDGSPIPDRSLADPNSKIRRSTSLSLGGPHQT